MAANPTYTALALDEDQVRELEASVLALEHDLIDLRHAVTRGYEREDYNLATVAIQQAKAKLARAEQVLQEAAKGVQQ